MSAIKHFKMGDFVNVVINRILRCKFVPFSVLQSLVFNDRRKIFLLRLNVKSPLKTEREIRLLSLDESSRTATPLGLSSIVQIHFYNKDSSLES